MQVNQRITRDKRMFMVMLLIGLIALITGFVLRIEKDLMLGISCGFIPTGIGGWIIYSRAPKSTQMLRNIEIEIDERNQFIGYRAAYTSFWIVYWLIFLVTMFAKFIPISISSLGIIMLFFMAVIFFFFRYIYAQKY